MTTPALYATIWVALGLFVAGEFGKRGQTTVIKPGSDHFGKTPMRQTPKWSDPGLTFSTPASPRLTLWWASACGLAIAAAHIVIALAINNDWNHAVAWRVTEERTREMFGFGWGGAVAANYAFLAYWAVDLWRWRTNPAGLAATAHLDPLGIACLRARDHRSRGHRLRRRSSPGPGCRARVGHALELASPSRLPAPSERSERAERTERGVRGPRE